MPERFAYGAWIPHDFPWNRNRGAGKGKWKRLESHPCPPGSDIKIFASPTWCTHRVWDFPIVLLSLCLTAWRAARINYISAFPRKISTERETTTSLRILAILFPCWLLEDQRRVFEFLLAQSHKKFRTNENAKIQVFWIFFFSLSSIDWTNKKREEKTDFG